MILHKTEFFQDLIVLTSEWRNIPETAIRRDYFIVMILDNLMNSKYFDSCVLKGGTSISKCYPNTIKRFSEDIDLTYIPRNIQSENQISKTLKEIEIVLVDSFHIEKIDDERSKRNKSSWVWYEVETNKVKLEIGSLVKPHPYHKKKLKSYIQQYLEEHDFEDLVEEYEMNEVEINVLDVSRTFIDKIMAVKRHAICGTLSKKVRHIYDVRRLYEIDEIKELLGNLDLLKEIVKVTKETDSNYLQKRCIPEEYNPLSGYNFEEWENKLDKGIKDRYESLHLDLLYTNKKQDFEEALVVFQKLNELLKTIQE